MPMKARYTVVNGEVIAEKRNGVRHLLVPDPLGSTRALLDNTQSQVATFTYWPFGEVEASGGTVTTPLQFVGSLGYYNDSSNRTYVRARYLRTDIARWQTPDPIGLAGGDYNLYRYVGNNPISLTDASGLGASAAYTCKKRPVEKPVWWDPTGGYYQQYAYCSRCVQSCEDYCNTLDTSCGPEPKQVGDCKDDCHRRYRKCRSKANKGKDNF